MAAARLVTGLAPLRGIGTARSRNRETLLSAFYFWNDWQAQGSPDYHRNLSAFIDMMVESRRHDFNGSDRFLQMFGEWPHYVAAKGAIEGLAQVAAVEFPGSRVVIARPPKLITDLTHTPMGQLEGLSPDDAAAKLVSTLLAPRQGSGHAEIFEDFGAPVRP